MPTTIDTHVFDVPATMCGAGRTQWAQCLEMFTTRNAGRTVAIEADLEELGALPAEVNARLSGVSYDRRDGAAQIMLGGTPASRAHRTVIVRDVLAVQTLVATTGSDVALRFAVPDGQVLLTFLPPERAAAAAAR